MSAPTLDPCPACGHFHNRPACPRCGYARTNMLAMLARGLSATMRPEPIAPVREASEPTAPAARLSALLEGKS